ncbi:hypothetical protein NCR96_02330 [Helicobacter sp. 14348-15]|uniref:hypothetical protein n=1 Tax=Helicobacter colisuis TaxID=2949739 RepID=UPI00202AFFCD|nr:hypothetical protein [Helicobacter colisuis]MCL9820586.1 hypothetical protein [Helicobacter colisuis]
MLMLAGGGLQYVDMEAVKNGYYGYLHSYYERIVGGGNGSMETRYEYYIGDYVRLLKTGYGNPKFYTSDKNGGDWKITNRQQGGLTFTHITSGYSFRASLKRQSLNKPLEIDRELITEDNPQLYEEIKQNASWL